MNICKALLLLLAPALVFAQTDGVQPRSPFDRGGTLISGIASFSSESTGGDTRTTVAIVPSAVFFIADRFGLGFDLSVNSVSVKNASQSLFAFGPKLMVAFGSAENTAYPYLGLGADYVTASLDEKGFPSSTTSGSIIKGGVGVIFKVSQHVGIPLEFGVLVINTDKSKESTTTIAVGTGISGLLY